MLLCDLIKVAHWVSPALPAPGSAFCSTHKSLHKSCHGHRLIPTGGSIVLTTSKPSNVRHAGIRRQTPTPRAPTQAGGEGGERSWKVGENCQQDEWGIGEDRGGRRKKLKIETTTRK